MAKDPFLIIDCDGTLVDTRLDILSALNVSLSAYDLDTYSEDEVLEYIGSGVYPLIKKRSEEAKSDAFSKEELFKVVLEHFQKTYSENVVVNSCVYAGWEKVFPYLKRERTVILSNKPQIFLDKIVTSLGLDTHIVESFGREAFPEIKPSPYPVLKILEKYKVSPEQAIMIGDMDSDIISGNDAGIKTFAVLYGYGKRDTLLKANPDFLIESPEEIIELLDKAL